MRLVNEGLAFLLELLALAALAYWGFTAGGGIAWRIGLGIGTPLVAALVWGLFAAPKATFALPIAGVLLAKAVVFSAAVAALFLRGQRILALIFAVLIVLNTTYITATRRPHP